MSTLPRHQGTRAPGSSGIRPLSPASRPFNPAGMRHNAAVLPRSPFPVALHTDLGESVAPGAPSPADFRLLGEHLPGSKPCLAQTPPFPVSLPSGGRGRLRSPPLSVLLPFPLCRRDARVFRNAASRHNPAPSPSLYPASWTTATSSPFSSPLDSFPRCPVRFLHRVSARWGYAPRPLAEAVPASSSLFSHYGLARLRLLTLADRRRRPPLSLLVSSSPRPPAFVRGRFIHTPQGVNHETHSEQGKRTQGRQ